ncbi:hypothetical protein RDI58_019790 [Solanum bulbocastanum]|uniref:Uncharacterized protein n=1 Tax=Solanum bulbocastanum TaxID=147425 RepID=A0AAN8T5X3_SOLBU
MRATIPKENMRKMVIIALMVQMERMKNLVMAPMMMMEHVRDLTHSESNDGSYDGDRTYYSSPSKDEDEVSNPLWCEEFPPKDGNLFLEDESTLVVKDYDEKEAGICFLITSSSWCVPFPNGMATDFEPISSHTYENTLDEVLLQDTFSYYLFAYDDTHACLCSIFYVNSSINRVLD